MVETQSREGIIDVHVHMNPFWRMNCEAYQTFQEHSANFERKAELARNPDRFIEYLDSQNVSTAAIINYVSPVLGYTHETNEEAAAFREACSDRVIAFGGFDPRIVDVPAAEIDRALTELELDGLKIHPPHQGIAANGYRDDPDTRGLDGLELLYERCAESNVPIPIHTGTSIFPDARSRPLSNLLDYFPEIERVDERVLFGSDWPGPMVPDTGGNVNAIRELPLSDRTTDRILRENAQSLFEL